MARRHRLVVAVALAGLLAAGVPAIAAEVAGVSVSGQASVGGSTLVLNGAGLRTRFLFKVYVGSLYLPHKASSLEAVLASAPRRVQLNLLRDLSAGQLVDALQDGLRDNNPPEVLAGIKRETDQLVEVMQAFGDVREGSVVTLDYIDGATHIGQDGRPKGTIAGEAFNRALLRIWLGEHPVQEDLRAAMLGG